MNPRDTYLRELSEIWSSGAAIKETSYYELLAILFNKSGKTLKPKGRSIINLKNRETVSQTVASSPLTSSRRPPRNPCPAPSRPVG